MSTAQTLPENFTYVNDPRIIVMLAYASDNNFLGRPVAGYDANKAILTIPAATALSQAQDTLDKLEQNLYLIIYDAYRPQRAVTDFVEWAKDSDSLTMQALYYPAYQNKLHLFRDGFIANNKSTHSRGSTVDIGIIQLLANGEYTPLDFGTIFDFFSAQSHTRANDISETARKNRQLLLDVMSQHGFKNYHKEWWHFTLDNEPYPNQYFDFPVR